MLIDSCNSRTEHTTHKETSQVNLQQHLAEQPATEAVEPVLHRPVHPIRPLEHLSPSATPFQRTFPPDLVIEDQLRRRARNDRTRTRIEERRMRTRDWIMVREMIRPSLLRDGATGTTTAEDLLRDVATRGRALGSVGMRTRMTERGSEAVGEVRESGGRIASILLRSQVWRRSQLKQMPRGRSNEKRRKVSRFVERRARLGQRAGRTMEMISSRTRTIVGVVGTAERTRRTTGNRRGEVGETRNRRRIAVVDVRRITKKTMWLLRRPRVDGKIGRRVMMIRSSFHSSSFLLTDAVVAIGGNGRPQRRTSRIDLGGKHLQGRIKMTVWTL